MESPPKKRLIESLLSKKWIALAIAGGMGAVFAAYSVGRRSAPVVAELHASTVGDAHASKGEEPTAKSNAEHDSAEHDGEGEPAHEQRKPASAPKSEPVEEESEEEEVEIRFATHGKSKEGPSLGINAAHASEAHAEAESENAAEHAKGEATHATTEHATTEHATAEHATAEHATADHATAEHATTEHASVAHGAHATVEHATGIAGIIARVRETLAGFQEKVERVKHADEEAAVLRRENANLRLQLETKKFLAREEDARRTTATAGEHLTATTGTSVGRTLSAIRYQIPENLLPEQLAALGVGYFKQHDDEKAVTIFTFLTELENDAAYRAPDFYLMTAISWYRLENFQRAGEYADRVLAFPAKKLNERYVVQAQLWKALIAKKNQNRNEAAKWIQAAVEKHPHRPETRWVNPQAGDRKPASKEDENHDDSKSNSKSHSPAHH